MGVSELPGCGAAAGFTPTVTLLNPTDRLVLQYRGSNPRTVTREHPASAGETERRHSDRQHTEGFGAAERLQPPQFFGGTP